MTDEPQAHDAERAWLADLILGKVETIVSYAIAFGATKEGEGEGSALDNLNKARAELEAALLRSGPQGDDIRGCMWSADSDGIFSTGCDRTFVFYEDGPEENGFSFCPYCGGELIDAAMQSEQQETKNG